MGVPVITIKQFEESVRYSHKRWALIIIANAASDSYAVEDMPQEDRDKMVNDLLAMYSAPKAIMAYANDAVFKDEFWNNISYQTERVTAAFKDGTIDVDTFMDTPMQELTKFMDENLRKAADSNSQIQLKDKKYYVGKGKPRYLWLATRMGMPTVKDAPGIEVIQTYNMLSLYQVVGLVLKNY